MKKNFIYNTLYQILSLIIPIIITPYLARTLGVDSIGIFSYTNSIATFFTIIAVFGTTTYGQRAIAYARDDRDTLSKTFFSVLSLRGILSLLVGGIYTVSIIFFPDYKIYLGLFVLNIINVFIDISWFYQGLEQFKTIVLRNIIVKILNLLSIFAFVRSESDLATYILIYCGFTIVGNLVTWFGIGKYIDFTRDIKPFQNIKDVLQLFFPTIAMQVYTVLDKGMLGWITKSTYESGCYEQAEKISRIVITIVAAIAIVIAPRVANLYSKVEANQAKKEEIHELIYMGVRIACMIGVPAMFGLIGITSIFVPVFLGEGYDKVYLLLPIFSFLIISVGLANVIGIAYLIPIKKQKVYTISITVSASVNFILNIILIPQFASIGAAIASVVAEAIGIIIQLTYCIVKEGFSVKRFAKILWKYIFAAIVMFVIVLLLVHHIAMSVIGLLAIIGVGGIIYGGILLLLKDDFLYTSAKKFIFKRQIKD